MRRKWMGMKLRGSSSGSRNGRQILDGRRKVEIYKKIRKDLGRDVGMPKEYKVEENGPAQSPLPTTV